MGHLHMVGKNYAQNQLKHYNHPVQLLEKIYHYKNKVGQVLTNELRILQNLLL